MPHLPPDATAVKRYLNELQDRITTAVENADTAAFQRDTWARPEGGGGDPEAERDASGIVHLAQKHKAQWSEFALLYRGNFQSRALEKALRLARGLTGRPLVLKFEGHYHGWSDEGLVGFAPPARNSAQVAQ